MTTLPPHVLAPILDRLAEANTRFARRYPGDSSHRQPVHTFYGGAHLFRSDLVPKLGALALRSLEDYAPDAEAFGGAIGLPETLRATIYARVLDKLRHEPVEDLRVDFEDGYGNRPDAEEDGHAVSAAREMATGLAAGTLPPHIGIRIKALTEELKRRSLRTLDLFLTELVRQGDGRLPGHFAVTLSKVTAAAQVGVLAEILARLEKGLGLPDRALGLEIMVETPQSIFAETGEVALLPLVEAAEGRCVGAHFGVYDFTTSLHVSAGHQHLAHPSADFARQVMQVALAGTGVFLSDGGTNVLPVPPHQGESTLTKKQIAENRAAIHAAWKVHSGHVRRSLEHAFYQGWDLHPAQLPTRFAALYGFFLEGLDAASARLTNFVAKAGQATLVGAVFDDAATGQALLDDFLRAWSCGAITQEEAIGRSGLTAEELRERSFLKILENRRR